jgi:predicted RND superfamily exporter protein
MHETQVALLTDLGYSFLSAFALITPVMMWMVRSILGGLLIMIPNILPVTLAFGTMGWMGWSLDIAGILTASIALGIAVDDTLHFSCWYMQELDRGHSRIEAIRRTFSNCSTAMLHTTVISCGAMTPFLFADFLPTQQFAKLMIAMLSAAIVGDLVILPALLLSPLGKVIGRNASNRLDSEQTSPLGTIADEVSK